MTTVLSIQSHVAYGYVGNSAAGFALMRQRVEPYPVLTVCFSNTTAYGSWHGPVLTPDDVSDQVRGIDERGALGVDGVLTGYQGSAAIGQAIVDAVALVRERNPKALYCCDPVMGDVGRGFFVAPGIPEFLRDQVVPIADVVTPNQFELEFLTGATVTSPDDLLAAADALRARGPHTVLVTSAVTTQERDNEVAMYVVSSDGAWRVVTPKLAQTFTGSGDITSATFLAGLLRTGSASAALAHTANVVFSVLEITAASGHRELRLVEAQDEFVEPRHTFEVSQVR